MSELPVKINLMGKTGYYGIDTLIAHILMILAVVITILLKKAKSLSIIM